LSTGNRHSFESRKVHLVNCIRYYIFITLGKTLAFVKRLCKRFKNPQQKNN